jgi:hypothetical protein
MYDFVWNFDTLNEEEEKQYVFKIIESKNKIFIKK